MLHAPSRREAKGSDEIRSTVERLQARGLPLELVELSGVPHQRSWKRCRTSTSSSTSSTPTSRWRDSRARPLPPACRSSSVATDATRSKRRCAVGRFRLSHSVVRTISRASSSASEPTASFVASSGNLLAVSWRASSSRAPWRSACSTRSKGGGRVDLRPAADHIRPWMRPHRIRGTRARTGNGRACRCFGALRGRQAGARGTAGRVRRRPCERCACGITTWRAASGSSASRRNCRAARRAGRRRVIR